MNNDLISREALKKEFEKVYPLSVNEIGGIVNKQIYDIIDNAPSVKAVPLEHHNKIKGIMDKEIKSLVDILDNEKLQGEWHHYTRTLNFNTFYITECTCCGFRVKDETNYCPNCGAKMETGVRDETDN